MVATNACPGSGLRIVVLAAGFSARLGRPKTLVKVHGMSLLRRTIGVLAQVVHEPILVVVPPRAVRLRAELRDCRAQLLWNSARGGGLSTSVRRALQQTRYSRGTLFLPADLALLVPRDIARLIARWHGQRRRVVACDMGGRASTPLILPGHLYSRALQVSGDRGLRDLVAALPAEDRLLIDLPSAGFDIDTPEDLVLARRRYSTGALRARGRAPLAPASL